MIGSALGARAEASPAIARLLADARTQTTLPELHPGATLVNRLWPLLLVTVGAGAAGFFEPQVAAVAAGFAIIWALAWRRQERAVLAIEERDGVRFYVDRTSPFSPIRLIRTPGFGGDYLADAVRDVLLVSLGGTAGLREADAELAASLRRAGASVEVARGAARARVADDGGDRARVGAVGAAGGRARGRAARAR